VSKTKDGVNRNHPNYKPKARFPKKPRRGDSEGKTSGRPCILVARDEPGVPSVKSRRVRKNKWVPIEPIKPKRARRRKAAK
jgi:hypothetical protein